MKVNEEDIKMFLFGRWIATCYADELMDKNGMTNHNPGFKREEALSVLNMTGGSWWKSRIRHFNSVVLPNYKSNGSYEDAKKFLNE
ncbi:MAG: hypothetical protein M0P71_01070 [Melioribacteraceae bacterium]|nr:hypothetical protein [Melioribacteraceae bacterium]